MHEYDNLASSGSIGRVRYIFAAIVCLMRGHIFYRFASTNDSTGFHAYCDRCKLTVCDMPN